MIWGTGEFKWSLVNPIDLLYTQIGTLYYTHKDIYNVGISECFCSVYIRSTMAVEYRENGATLTRFGMMNQTTLGVLVFYYSKEEEHRGSIIYH